MILLSVFCDFLDEGIELDIISFEFWGKDVDEKIVIKILILLILLGCYIEDEGLIFFY